MAKTTVADRLARAKNKAVKKEEKPKKSDLRVLDIPERLHEQVRDLCMIGTLFDRVKSLLGQHADAVRDEFFLVWTEEMWANKRRPDNFNVRLKQCSGKLDDAACQFQLKFRSDGIKKKMPSADNLPEEKTLQEVVIDILTSGVVGLTAENARRFVDQEVDVQEETTLSKPLETMLEEEEGTLFHSIGDKLLTYMQTRANGRSKTVSLPPFTDEEEEAALSISQVVKLKEGMLDRVFTYCTSLEELRRLLKWVEVTKQVSNYEFGISDETGARGERLKEAVGRFIVE